MNTSLNTIPAKFRHIVEAMPQETAVIDSDFKTYTYKQLADMADAVRSSFGKNHRRVGILMGHGIVQIASILAVIEAGGAYVAVEPSLPGERIRRIFSEAELISCLPAKPIPIV